MSSEKSSSKKRMRNAATIVYPESAPADWLDVLRNFHVNAFVSPLHDKDVNPSDSEPKKPHYHILMMFDSVHTVEQFKSIFDSIGGVGFEEVSSLRGYARYLCHLDNPEKYQYQISDVVSVGSEDYQSIISLPSDKYKLTAEMMDFCRNNHIMYYYQLLDYARENQEDWFRALCDSCTYQMSQFFISLRYHFRDAGDGFSSPDPRKHDPDKN